MNKRVVWCEGMMLTAQHFQLWDEFYRKETQENIRQAMNWGIVNLDISTTAILNKQFKLNTIKARFKNGVYIDFNDVGEQSLSYQLPDVIDKPLTLFIACPDNDFLANHPGYEINKHKAGWLASFEQSPDRYAQNQSQEICFAEPNIKLLSSQDSLKTYSYLPIAGLKQTCNGYELQRDFIFPCVSLHSCKAIEKYIQDLKQVLTHYLNRLKANGFSNTNSFDDNYLYACVSELLCELNILSCDRHPQALYKLLASFIAKINVYVNEDLINQCQRYQHEDIHMCFIVLKELIQSFCKERCRDDGFDLVLIKQSETHFYTNKIDDDVLEKESLYLLIDKAHSDKVSIEGILSRVKVSATTHSEVMSSALSGLELIYDYDLSRDSHWLKLLKKGEVWQQIKTCKSIAIHIAKELINNNIKLRVMKNEL